MELTVNVLLTGSLLLFGSILAGRAGSRFGMPALLLFLGVGMLFGTDGVGIEFNSPAVAQFVGMVALSIILFSGGMDTKIAAIKPIAKEGVVLATFGVLLTAGVSGLFIYMVSGILSLTESFLLASIMPSTDSASVFSILRAKKQGLKQQLQPLLELESGSNDPMAYMLTILLLQVIQTGELGLGGALWLFAVQMSVGALLGWLLGIVAVKIINFINLDNHSMYSLLLLAFVFFTFSVTDMLHGNGYLAVYIAGLVVGNKKMAYRRSMATFFDGLTWLFQIVMFLTLGLLVNPSELLDVVGIGVAVSAFLILGARPIAVFLSLMPFRKFTLKARAYVSWVGLRGAVPIIFATYPLLAGLENAKYMFNLVFFVTIASLLTQGTTVSWMAKLLGLSTPESHMAFGVTLPDEVKSGLSEIEVKSVLFVNGNQLKDLTLPDNTLVVMIKRGDDYFVPKGDTKLEEGDKLLVISDNDEELQREYQELGLINSITKDE